MLEAVSKRLVLVCDTMGPSDLVNSLYGLGKFHFQQDGGTTAGLLSASVRRHLDACSFDQMSQVLSSLIRLGSTNQPLVSAVVGRVLREPLTCCSFQGLVNLMVAFARFGVRPIKNVWGVLADEVCVRLTESSYSRSDLLAAIRAYSVMHVGTAHANLFQSVSAALKVGPPLLPEEVCMYVKACSRAQFREVEMLTLCGSSLRQHSFCSLSDSALLELFSGLDKLGVDMDELSGELKNRGVSVPTKSAVVSTWLRPAVARKPVAESKSLRRRKWTW